MTSQVPLGTQVPSSLAPGRFASLHTSGVIESINWKDAGIGKGCILARGPHARSVTHQGSESSTVARGGGTVGSKSFDTLGARLPDTSKSRLVYIYVEVANRITPSFGGWDN